MIDTLLKWLAAGALTVYLLPFVFICGLFALACLVVAVGEVMTLAERVAHRIKRRKAKGETT